MIVLRYLDIVVLIIALPVFLVGGLPILGYVAGGGIWVVQRAIQLYANKKAVEADDPRTTVGIAAAGRATVPALRREASVTKLLQARRIRYCAGPHGPSPARVHLSISPAPPLFSRARIRPPQP